MWERELIGRRTDSTETWQFIEGRYAIDLEIGARRSDRDFYNYMRLAREHAQRVLWKAANFA